MPAQAGGQLTDALAVLFGVVAVADEDPRMVRHLALPEGWTIAGKPEHARAGIGF